MNNYGDNFINNLKREMNKQNFSQEKLAQKAGISRDAIASYYRDKDPKTPNLTTAVMIANALNVSLDELCGQTIPVTTNQKMSPEEYLMCVVNFIKLMGFEFDLINEKIVLTNSNKILYNFLKQIKNINNDTFIKDNAKSYNNGYKIFENNLLTQEEYLNIISNNERQVYNQKCNEYVYNGMFEYLDEFPEECAISMKNRRLAYKLFNKLNTKDDRLLEFIQEQVNIEYNSLEKRLGNVEYIFYELETKSYDIVKNAKEVYNKEGNKK